MGGAESAQTLGLIAATLDALDATAAALRARAAQGVPLSAWLHALRSPVTGMAGWAQILNNLGLDEKVRRRRALDAIERNARLLEQLLAKPPG